MMQDCLMEEKREVMIEGHKIYYFANPSRSRVIDVLEQIETKYKTLTEPQKDRKYQWLLIWNGILAFDGQPLANSLEELELHLNNKWFTLLLQLLLPTEAEKKS